MDRTMRLEGKLAVGLKALRQLIFAAMQFRFGVSADRR
jgi:hypothetical protein